MPAQTTTNTSNLNSQVRCGCQYTINNQTRYAATGNTVRMEDNTCQVCYITSENPTCSAYFEPAICQVTEDSFEEAQPTLTQRINELEERFGINVVFFEGYTPTEADIEVLENAFELLPESYRNGDGALNTVVYGTTALVDEQYSGSGHAVAYVSSNAPQVIYFSNQEEISINCGGNIVEQFLYRLQNLCRTISPEEAFVHESIHTQSDREIESETYCGSESSCTMLEGYSTAAAADGIDLYTQTDPEYALEENYVYLVTENMSLICSSIADNHPLVATDSNLYRYCMEVVFEGGSFLDTTDEVGNPIRYYVPPLRMGEK